MGNPRHAAYAGQKFLCYRYRRVTARCALRRALLQFLAQLSASDTREDKVSVVNTTTITSAADAAGPSMPVERTSILARRIFLALAAVALIYAFIAGLRTVADPDLGWQLATGRWVAQHHHVPSTDVFSYTANGQPWIYPVGSGLLFYAIYLLGGYALLSWLGVIACLGTVALLLRRGSAFTAAIAIFAMPMIAARTAPRAEMFTVVLFAAYLSILWQNYRTGRAPLWCLPLLMAAWANLHLGFIAGLALILGFAGMELLEMISSRAKRRESLVKIKALLVWFAASAAATLLNPWGWKLYDAIIRQNRAMALHSQVISEWASSHWSWSGSLPTFAREPLQNTLTVFLVIVVIAAVTAVFEGEAGAAILLCGAMYVSVRHIRMEALSACVVVIVGGAILSAAVPRIRSWIPKPRTRAIAAITVTVLVAALASVRAADFVSNRVYLATNDLWNFGAGAAWWIPQRAAEFIQRENLPANVFTSYNEGGYLVWKLGPKYLDYIDGRAIPFGNEAFEHEREMLAMPIDSSMWTAAADRYNINTIILSLVGNEVTFDQLQDFCNSSNWRPVYLDELAIVLVRNKPDNQELINRLQVNCPVATLPATPLDNSAKSYSQWVNTAYVLFVLHRNAEALSAADTAFRIFPDNARLRWVRGNIYYVSSRRTEAEEEWLAAIALRPDADVWARLADLYDQQQRVSDAAHAYQETIRLTTDPIIKARSLVKLARLYLINRQPQQALQALDDAMKIAPAPMLAATKGRNFRFDVAQGRAAVWRSEGDISKAISFQEEATQLDPDAADAWSHLAKLYKRAGRAADEKRAQERASALAPEEPASPNGEFQPH